MNEFFKEMNLCGLALSRRMSWTLYFITFFLWCIQWILLCVASLPQQNLYFDKNVILFSEQGELLQVQYAKKAGLLGNTLICGVSLTDQEIVVCVPETRKVHYLLDKSFQDKILRVDRDIFLAFSGLGGDGRAITNFARRFCADLRVKLNFPPSLTSVSRSIAQLQHSTTLEAGTRPFGVQTLLLGYSRRSKNMEIHWNEPSGETLAVYAMAIGKSSLEIIPQLENEFNNHLSSIELAELFTRLIKNSKGQIEEDDNSESNNDSFLRYYLLYFDGQECQVQSFSSLEDMKLFKTQIRNIDKNTIPT